MPPVTSVIQQPGMSEITMHEVRSEDGVTRRVIKEKPKIDHLVGRAFVPFFVEGTDDVNEDLDTVADQRDEDVVGAVAAREWNHEGYFEEAKLVGTNHAMSEHQLLQQGGQPPASGGKKAKGKGKNKGKGKAKRGGASQGEVTPPSAAAAPQDNFFTKLLAQSQQNRIPGQPPQQKQNVASPAQPSVPSYASIAKTPGKKKNPQNATGKGKGKGKKLQQQQLQQQQYHQQYQQKARVVSVPMQSRVSPQGPQGVSPPLSQTPPLVMNIASMAQPPAPHTPPQQVGIDAAPKLLTPADLYSATPVLDEASIHPQYAPHPSAPQSAHKPRRPSADVDAKSRFAGAAFSNAPAPDALPIPAFGAPAQAPPAPQQQQQPQRDTAAMTRDLRSMLGVGMVN